MQQLWNWAMSNTRLVLFVALILLVLVRLLVSARRRSRLPVCDGVAHCKACGYELGTLAGGRCPECGADLLRVGVIGSAEGERR